MTRKPFALSAYLAFARGRPAAPPAPPPAPRPDGPLIWLHADRAETARALAALAARMQVQRPEVAALLTWPAGMATPPDAPRYCLAQPLPGDSLSEAQDFAAYWRPDLGLWTGQTLRPALLTKLSEAGTRLAHLGARNETWYVPAPLWVPDCTTAALALFDRIFAEDDPALRRLRRMGLPDSLLRRAGPLSETAPPLDCPPELHEEMAQTLSGRPVWLAAKVRADEATDILRAHRRATRLAHRLILILVPASPRDGAAIAETACASDLRVARWDAGEMPDENCQVLLTEDASELGLWYRLAPIAFLGGSLRPGHGGEDPLEAAAHGAALLYGPNVGRHLSAYTRLVEAGAARIVRDFDTLAAAVSQLVAPDRAAAMAHAGWDVVSQGAALTDEVIALAFQWLDGDDGGNGTGEAA
ncbi:3-deoxy-D-manno-octulosonic acid transferase [Salipiger sp. P9]|uniref:3-deoxy-D-manno-octulosonic acid transferase n=1 Tax=Salipiger pentaromativorans TaxID=2943193 RepID=UPI002156FA2A|nr:glycosyltransferase N-terminal domain-containing protein [Salipiger pentaromativorans]MCR8546627.1 3-deoxy-D-manno-octulosonic acid transferase [Salipiger pentaromativorans]